MCLSSDAVNCVAFKPDNPNILVSCSDDKTIKMWDIDSGSILSTLRGHSRDNPECLCDFFPYRANPECPVRGHSDWVQGLAFNPRDPQMLVSCSDDRTIKVWNITSGACLSTLSCDRYDATPLYIECVRIAYSSYHT